MSVYSGFATRQQETFYDKLLFKALQLLSIRVINFYKGESMPDETKWVKQVRKLFKYLLIMDKNKYLEPKYSESLTDLSNFLKSHIVNLFHVIDLGYGVQFDNNFEPFAFCRQSFRDFPQTQLLSIKNSNWNSSLVQFAIRQQCQAFIGSKTNSLHKALSNQQRGNMNKTQITQNLVNNKGIDLKQQIKMKLSPIKTKGNHSNIKRNKDQFNINRNYNANTLSKVIDSKGNIVEKQEEEDDLASSSKVLLDQKGELQNSQDLSQLTDRKDQDDTNKQNYDANIQLNNTSFDSQTTKPVQQLHQVNLTKNLQRKFASQPRGAMALQRSQNQSIMKEQTPLPDIPYSGGRNSSLLSHNTNVILNNNANINSNLSAIGGGISKFKKRKLSSISSHSTRSLKTLMMNSTGGVNGGPLNSSRNRKQNVLKQSYRGSLMPPDAYKQFFETRRGPKSSNKYVRNIIQIQNSSQVQVEDTSELNNQGISSMRKGDHHIIMTAPHIKQRRRNKHKFQQKSVYRQVPNFVF